VSRILIVEDEQDLANLLTYNLSAAGFETETSHSGAAALSRAKAFKPDLVLLDLMLPDLPGSEVLRLIKEDPNLRRTAVVMVTAKGQESDRVQGLEMGADDYVVKPFSVRELALRVKAVLRRMARDSEGTGVLSAGSIKLDPPATR
jgi:two-component system phosphate regulon response regulator PhoB